MKFIGVIAFLDSVERQNRITTQMSFEVMVDWVSSVIEFYRQDVRTGEFDGTEILVQVYEFNPERNSDIENWDYDSDDIMDSIIIPNPYSA
jgi:hypothetical protein